MGSINKLNELQYRRNAIEAGSVKAREHINALLDEGSFIELDAFVNHRCVDFGMDATEAPADGVVIGYGSIDGRLVYVYAQDSTVLNGALGEMHAKKICKVYDLAASTGAPVIGLVDSMGARIAEGIAALNGYGEIYSRAVRYSGVIPQIVAVMGTCAGAATVAASVADFVFMTKDNGCFFMNGAQVVSAASGVSISDDELGGADAVSTKSGACHFTAIDANDCMVQIKKLVSLLPGNNLEETPFVQGNDEINRVCPDLNGIEGVYDVKSVINNVVDVDTFIEVSRDYARNMVIGLARMNGSTVGIVANQTTEHDGVICINAAQKAARFVRFCDAFNIPIVVFTNASGFACSPEQEFGGLSKAAAKLVYAFAEATVPKVNVILGKAYGSAYLAMCSKSIGADMVYAWPSAEVAILDPNTTANIVFENDIAQSANSVETRNSKIEEYRNKYASPFEAAKMGYVDDVIEPDSTRPRVIAAVEMLAGKRDSLPAKKHGNIPV